MTKFLQGAYSTSNQSFSPLLLLGVWGLLLCGTENNVSKKKAHKVSKAGISSAPAVRTVQFINPSD